MKRIRLMAAKLLQKEMRQHPFCVIHNYYKLLFIFFFFLFGGGGGGRSNHFFFFIFVGQFNKKSPLSGLFMGLKYVLNVDL